MKLAYLLCLALTLPASAERYLISCNAKTCEVGKADLKRIIDRLEWLESTVDKACL